MMMKFSNRVNMMLFMMILQGKKKKILNLNLKMIMAKIWKEIIMMKMLKCKKF